MKPDTQEDKCTDWSGVWEGEDITRWDYLSQVILNVLKEELGPVAGKTMLEAGSGTGRISLRLAREGAVACLLDNFANALDLSRKMFVEAGKDAGIICADIRKMPYRDVSFDVVWNAGVIEHFAGEEQESVLREMSRVCKKGGLVITINPYARSALHSFGKGVMEKLGIYPFKDEVPIDTLGEKATASNLRLRKKEYSIGFIVLWVGMFKRLTLFPMGRIFSGPLSLMNKTFCGMDSSFFGETLRRADSALAKLFGGYLLVTVFEKI